MKGNMRIYAAASCVCMGLLILDSKTALEGARDGIDLAVNILIPSLFPFLFLSVMLANGFQGVEFPALRAIGQLFHLPNGAEGILITAFLGGYPAGAQALGEKYHRGQISKENAERMLAFCSNAGPSFLFGMTAACFSKRWMIWILWLFHILGAFVAARRFPCLQVDTAPIVSVKTFSLTEILKRSLSVMAVICGWVILFRVVVAFADKWFLWLVPAEVRTGIIGILELSNGICELRAIENENARFVICSGMLSMGGLCVALQTVSVSEGLDQRFYYRGKAVQTLVSLCCSATLMYHITFLFPLIVLLPLNLSKKRSGNLTVAGV